uniref:Integrator complex subunit 7 n=1 Tax=Haemonchus contortus TaxID=6289 RepID=W6NFP3_HAECO
MATELVQPALHSSIQLQSFEKGLRSPSLGDQLATVVSTASLIKANPFPMYVNTIVVRLADAFKDGSNPLRMTIARVLSECKSHLSLVFSGSEIFKRFLSVSHSNDPVARAMTLQALASLAPISPESKQVHHLIVESMSAENAGEFQAACHAMSAFAHLSSDFSSTIIGQLSELLLAEETTYDRKAQIVKVFAKMKATVTSMKEVFSLTTRLLEISTFNELICPLLDSTTTLAEATRYAIPEQLDILIGVVSGCHGDNFPVCMSTLHNIARLAKHSHVWREDHLKKLHQLKSRVSSNPNTYQRYLEVLVGLTKRARPGLIMGLYETLSELGYLGQSDCMEMRIRYLQISCNIVCRVPNERKWQMLCGPFLDTIEYELPTKLAIKLYRTLGRFMCCNEVPPEQILSLLDGILKIPLNHGNIAQLIEFCCQIASRLPFVVSKLHHWAREVVAKESQLSGTALIYLLLAPSVHLPKDVDTLMKGTDLDRYVAARVAFRNGHWKKAAFPNLKAICTDRLSLENCEWIQALQSLAASQLNDFSVAALFEQNRRLYKTHSILKSLAQSSQHEAALSFPSDWVACLLYSSDAALQIASAISPTLNWCAHPLSAAVVFRVKKALIACDFGISRACQAWLRLARSSFGADEETIDFLALQHKQCALVQYALHCITGRQASVVPLPTSSGNSTHTQLLLEQLQIASGQIEQLAASDEGITMQSLKHFVEMLRDLFTYPIYMPRFFFQQMYSTNIQMSVSIHSQIKDGITVSITDTVPIQVDGVISTTHTVPVHSLIITASMQFPTMPALNYTETRTVKPTENIHFTANFLMQFKQSCNIEFSVEFVDGEQGKRWVSDTTASLKVDVKE